MTRHLSYYSATLLLGIGFCVLCAGCGKNETASPAAPTADQAQAQQQAGEQAGAAAKAQGDAAAKAAAANKSGTTK